MVSIWLFSFDVTGYRSKFIEAYSKIAFLIIYNCSPERTADVFIFPPVALRLFTGKLNFMLLVPVALQVPAAAMVTAVSLLLEQAVKMHVTNETASTNGLIFINHLFISKIMLFYIKVIYLL